MPSCRAFDIALSVASLCALLCERHVSVAHHIFASCLCRAIWLCAFFRSRFYDYCYYSIFNCLLASNDFNCSQLKYLCSVLEHMRSAAAIGSFFCQQKKIRIQQGNLMCSYTDISPEIQRFAGARSLVWMSFLGNFCIWIVDLWIGILYASFEENMESISFVCWRSILSITRDDTRSTGMATVKRIDFTSPNVW